MFQERTSPTIYVYTYNVLKRLIAQFKASKNIFQRVSKPDWPIQNLKIHYN